VPDDLDSLPTDQLTTIARAVGAILYGESSREDLIKRIRFLAL